MEPQGNVRDQRPEPGRRRKPDKKMQRGKHRGRGADRRQGEARAIRDSRADQRSRDAVAVHDPSEQKVAEREPDHGQSVGKGIRAAACSELFLHRRHDHDDRPDADIADRGDGQRDGEAKPGITAVENVGGFGRLPRRGVARPFRSRPRRRERSRHQDPNRFEKKSTCLVT